ncbi:response regulator transcription factor [Cohnella boryungensis]|uniref:Response regulator n=1 Tax=Cohnella boryungensis TaxID=768479 RepID=A0ABV8SIK8_9BACL
MWKIVIIDDDRNVLKGMRRVIPWDELGAEWVGEAMDGEEGLRLIRQTQPDLVITDIYMPVMNGLEMIEHLRSDDFLGKIVILSGYTDFEYARQAMRLNVVDYLTKPVSVATLKTVLHKAVTLIREEHVKHMVQVELSERLTRYQPFIEREWVKSVVSGTLDRPYREDDELPPAYGFWKKARHLVIGIEIARDARVNAFSIADMNLIRFAVRNVVREIASEIFSTYAYTELHGTRSAVLIHPGPSLAEAELRMNLRQFGSEVIESVSRYLKVNLRMGWGRTTQHWGQISDSTEEAFRAIELRESPALKGFELYEITGEICSPETHPLPRPVKFYQELTSAIKNGHAGLAYRLIEDQFQSLEKSRKLMPSEVQLIAGELWGVITYSLYEVGIVVNEMLSDRLPQMEIVRLTRLDSLVEWLQSTVSEICRSREWKGSNKHRHAVEFMLQYIHENYAEDVTIGELADKVSISRNYLSEIFRNIAGDTFNNYLTRVRMEKAKELLLEKNMLVYEVADRVGYKNVPYFSNLFKKHVGVNPTDLTKGSIR